MRSITAGDRCGRRTGQQQHSSVTDPRAPRVRRSGQPQPLHAMCARTTYRDQRHDCWSYAVLERDVAMSAVTTAPGDSVIAEMIQGVGKVGVFGTAGTVVPTLDKVQRQLTRTFYAFGAYAGASGLRQPSRRSWPMWKSIRLRAKSAFTVETPDSHLVDFLSQLQTNRRVIAAEQRRTSWLILLLIAILVLIDRAQIAGGSVLFVQLRSFDLVAPILPPAIGYLVITSYLLLLDDNYASALHDAILAIREPQVTGQALELMIAPPTSSWYLGGRIGALYGTGGRGSDFAAVIVGVFTTTLPLMLSTGIFAFLFYELIAFQPWTSILAWISALVTMAELVFFGLLVRVTRLPWNDDNPANPT